MPINKNPSDVKSGPGKRVPPKEVKPALEGVTGTPAFGTPGADITGTAQALQNWMRAQNDSTSAALAAHVTDTHNAHPASAISFESPDDLYDGNSLDDALGEIAGAIPPKPPTVGTVASWTTLTGVPDWGVLKLNDASLIDQGTLISTNNPREIFPYYYRPPTPAMDTAEGFEEVGWDQNSDYVWNSGLTNFVTLEGVGPGEAHAGGYTRPGAAPSEPVFRTTRLMFRRGVVDATYGKPGRLEATISGTLYPADQGVLALIHWPAGTGGGIPDIPDFLAQPLLDRCIAALVVGQGLLGAGCSSEVGDGDAGGIFDLGRDALEEYDPFAFPGRATGQYNLAEIHAGVDALNGVALKPPFDDFNATGVPGAVRDLNSTVPAAGQVRLGTDPQADEGTLSYGIPILGGDSTAYNPAPPAYTTSIPALAHLIVGNSIVQSVLGGDSNFFGYRLPYLKDYSTLKWTPQGVDPRTTREQFRFWDRKTPSTTTTKDGTDISAGLVTAGNYGDPFDEDYWPYQVARYRHEFLMPSIAATGEKDDIGTYWLIHFKKERDFEAFVRDGVMPWDATAPYEVWGISLVDTTDIEEDANVVNQETSTTVPAPQGVAPDYGYTAEPYHVLRDTMLQSPGLPALPGFDPQLDWAGGIVPVADNIMWVSGVAYFVPIAPLGGGGVAADTRFPLSMSVISNLPHGFFDTNYRTDPNTLTGIPGVAPAVISSPAPFFVGWASWAWDQEPGLPGQSSMNWVATVPAGVGPSDEIGIAVDNRLQRIEVPFTFISRDATLANRFTDADGPTETDQFHWNDHAAATDFTPYGDNAFPAFSRNLETRCFLRRPLNHTTPDTSTEPFSIPSGHGIKFNKVPDQTILYHSTRFNSTDLLGEFGNIQVLPIVYPPPGIPLAVFPQLSTSGKDTQERFLDEVYRYRTLFGPGIVTVPGAGYTAQAVASLNGPGMGGWFGGGIETPVQISIVTSVGAWELESWLRMSENVFPIGTWPTNFGLQVTGLPDRNPPLSEGNKYQVPSAGILQFPQQDFSVITLRPNFGDDTLGFPQPDYTGIPGPLTYTRCFDADFSRSGTPEGVVGDSHVYLRFDGIQLEDFEFVAPGPGAMNAADAGFALYLKVPGMTTWMDLGRVDGAGPSKQDATKDGAGCQVVGPHTLNGVDAETGYVYCQVKAHVGPAATLFKSLGTGVAGITGEVPVLVKIEANDGAVNYNLESLRTGTRTFSGVPEEGLPSGDVRGIIGARVIRPSAAESA